MSIQKNFHTSTNAEHLQDLNALQGPLEEDFCTISTRSSHKDLYEIMQGYVEDFTLSLQDLLTRARTSSRQRL